jgi:hypothetical protein
MKKKVFSLMAVVLFLGSMTSMTSPKEDLLNDYCTNESFDMMGLMLDDGFTWQQSACAADWVYYACIGNLVTFEDIAGCLF